MPHNIILRILFFFCFTGKAFFLHAQLCTGSLGDPVVNITFGSGNAVSTNYTTSAYSYVKSDCPTDGFFTITNYTMGCYSNTWHAVSKDHTGDNGNYMLVNASYDPGDFFKTTVSDLCPNTNYQFSAWICNILQPYVDGINPNITFTIETTGGIVLQQYSTGDIEETDEPVWKQFGFYFTSPSENLPVVLRITNNAPGGTGNDLALDDITFRPCGSTITSSIQGHSDSVDVCEGNNESFQFNGNVSSAYFDPVYHWQVSTNKGDTWVDIPGADQKTYTHSPVVQTGIYLYRLTVTNRQFSNLSSCRIASNSLLINVHPKPIVNAGPDRIALAGDSIHLSGTVTGENPVNYWSPPDYLSDRNSCNPVVFPIADIEYSLYGESAFGCRNQDKTFVKVVRGIFVPTAFTPNNDGKNDHWHIPYLDPFLGAEVYVYNRYGKLVYHTKGMVVDWDGTIDGVLQPSAVYVYLIRFKILKPDMKGTVTLIR